MSRNWSGKSIARHVAVGALMFCLGSTSTMAFLLYDYRHYNQRMTAYLFRTMANETQAREKLHALGLRAIVIDGELADDYEDCVGPEGCYVYRALTQDGRLTEGVVRAGRKT